MKVEVNKNAKAYAKADIIIHAPVEKVYNALADIPGWPKWQSAVTKAQVHGSVKENSDFTWKANGMTVKSRLHTVTKPSEIGWTGKMAWIKAIHNWRILKEDNSTHVIVEESMAGMGSSLMVKTLRESLIKSLDELKVYTENTRN